MLVADLPPKLILPDYYNGGKPAIIRSATADLLNPNDPRFTLKSEQKQKAFLPGWFPARSKGLPFVLFVAQGGSATNAETYTFNTVNFGPAADKRVLVWTFNFNGIPGAFSLDSSSIGGVAATVSPSSNAFTYIHYARVDAADNGTLTINFASGPGSSTQMNWGLFAIYNLDSTTAIFTNSNDAEPPSLTINVPANGVLIAGSRTTSATNTGTWTGVTEAAEFTTEAGGSSFSCGAYVAGAAETGRTVTRNWTTSTSCGLAAASFR